MLVEIDFDDQPSYRFDFVKESRMNPQALWWSIKDFWFYRVIFCWLNPAPRLLAYYRCCIPGYVAVKLCLSIRFAYSAALSFL